ncbi:OPT oligopeptide transporter protein-domain-containing protein [Staphylotrichum tortipilum]|uniref:OPT oligopeptide transporter protein-domain-containing protein n=1 Tax=Staphylotrichum tortipilum TaxID=2831512 RepID=A0AAN6MSN7_9PEZI|nr:OPT oligopeptide transporter protein-domain-containing protein [Staphylotrichum longicolle]
MRNRASASPSSQHDDNPPQRAANPSPSIPPTSDGPDLDPDDTLALLPPSPMEDDDNAAVNSLRKPCRPRHRPVIAGASFTARGVLVGLAVGLVICFSNMYFGLQTGWVSTMTMPASLMGFGIFRLLRGSRLLEGLPFSPVENVLVQTVAGSMAIMPLGCGFVGVLPAMNYLLREEEQGPIVLGLGKLVLWSLGLCYFGVVFAVPLRRQVIIRERLRFPSGFSTAVLIGVLHGKGRASEGGDGKGNGGVTEGFASLAEEEIDEVVEAEGNGDEEEEGARHAEAWRRNVRLLLVCFLVSGLFTFATYFLPVLRNIPIFGSVAASTWLWTLNPSLAYVGQGIIMGPETTLHMLLGAVVGWGVLSPLAKNKGWAPAPVGDWENGSKGWIVWTSLAIMLADAVVSLGYLAFRSTRQSLPQLRASPLYVFVSSKVKTVLGRRTHAGYAPINTEDIDDAAVVQTPGLGGGPSSRRNGNPRPDELDDETDTDDAPLDQQVSDRVVAIGLVLSILFCILCIHIVFGYLVPLYATVTAVLMALILSIMGVRALGETDLNPVSGISKLAQLFFALIIPQSNKSSVLINLVAGAVSEAGALQAGDMMQDLKTGHLLGAAPKAQFWGQVIGATAGAVVSAFIYRLYTSVYQIPGDLFQVPTGYVWIFTARLVTGKGLPPMAREWAIGSAVLFAATTALRTRTAGTRWHALIPGGIAVAVGMYNVPSFTLARTAGGLLSWWWRRRMGWQDTPLIVLASGFILGEGFLSIVNLLMQSAGVPHLA